MRLDPLPPVGLLSCNGALTCGNAVSAAAHLNTKTSLRHPRVSFFMPKENHMPYTGGYPRASEVKVARARWDFSVDGGAVGDILIGSTGQIPSGAYITGGFVQVDTVVTGGASA